jgi:hypothetical protein
MAAPRLTDSQKSELVARYREGHTSAALAEAYGCSLNTVSRVVKAALDPADYAQLKQQRAKAGGVKAPSLPGNAASTVTAPVPDPADSPADAAVEEAEEPVEISHLELAIDDADDFGDDGDDGDAGEADALDGENLDADGAADFAAEQFLAVPIELVHHSHEPAQCQPLVDATLPSSVYMLVDKTVELQAKPLREFPELGHLPADEEERQALMVFSNPRQAKRHCGRTQRVIKVPDTRIFERTASYLLAQGISRVVMEGSLYSLPGS